MQHFRVKIHATTGPGFESGAAIPVFHRWIQNRAFEELLIDVADYRHVPVGPGVVLVGHDSFYGLDQGGHRTGLLYTRRTTLDGTPRVRIAAAYDAAVKAARLLAGEPEFAGRITFHADQWELSVNDRLLAPNNDDTFGALEPELREFLDGRFGVGKTTFSRTGEPRSLLSVSISCFL
jgi:hypothetical protein